MAGGRRQAVSRFIERWLVNPVIRALVRSGHAPRAFVVLETTGRKSGQPRQTPVNNCLEGDTFWIIAGHGRQAQYVQNLVADPHVRIKIGDHWRTGTATVLDDDDAHARRRQIDRRNGIVGRLDAYAFWAVATDPTTVRVDLDPA